MPVPRGSGASKGDGGEERLRSANDEMTGSGGSGFFTGGPAQPGRETKQNGGHFVVTATTPLAASSSVSAPKATPEATLRMSSVTVCSVAGTWQTLRRGLQNQFGAKQPMGIKQQQMHR